MIEALYAQENEHLESLVSQEKNMSDKVDINGPLGDWMWWWKQQYLVHFCSKRHGISWDGSPGNTQPTLKYESSLWNPLESFSLLFVTA